MPNTAVIWVDDDGGGLMLHCQACGRMTKHRPVVPKIRCRCTIEFVIPVELRRAYVVDAEIGKL